MICTAYLYLDYVNTCFFIFFFFFKQKTAYEMRISDWSSDVCSSDLLKWIRSISTQSAEENLRVSMNTTDAIRGLNELPKPTVALVHGGCFGGGTGMLAGCDIVLASEDAIFALTESRGGLMAAPLLPQLHARLGDRQSGVWGKSRSVCVDLGGSRKI